MLNINFIVYYILLIWIIRRLIDIDLSEKLLVILQGLHLDVVFKLDGVEIDKGYITYDKSSDTYTIDNRVLNHINIFMLFMLKYINTLKDIYEY